MTARSIISDLSTGARAPVLVRARHARPWTSRRARCRCSKETGDFPCHPCLRTFLLPISPTGHGRRTNRCPSGRRSDGPRASNRQPQHSIIGAYAARCSAPSANTDQRQSQPAEVGPGTTGLVACAVHAAGLGHLQCLYIHVRAAPGHPRHRPRCLRRAVSLGASRLQIPRQPFTVDVSVTLNFARYEAVLGPEPAIEHCHPFACWRTFPPLRPWVSIPRMRGHESRDTQRVGIASARVGRYSETGPRGSTWALDEREVRSSWLRQLFFAGFFPDRTRRWFRRSSWKPRSSLRSATSRGWNRPSGPWEGVTFCTRATK